MHPRAARIVKLSLVFAVALVVLGRAPGAWACTCAQPGTVQYQFDSSDLVFAGTAESMKDPNAGAPMQSSGDPIEWTFNVDSTQKGNTSDPQVVSSARSGVTCGYEFRIGKRYQVFADRQGGSYRASLCSGTHVLAAGEKPLQLSLANTAPQPVAAEFALGLALLVAGAFLRSAASRASARVRS